MKIYAIWLGAIILWNFGFPEVHPFADVLAAVVLKYAADLIAGYI